MDVQLKDEIEALRKLKTKALKARYFELFGEVSPSSNHTHIFRRLAWRLQARAQGGLSDRARQRAVALADEADIRLRAPKWFWGELGRSTESNRDLRLPPPGTVLNRMHQGHNIEVKIIGEGGAAFEYNGKTYQSLSAIAHKVTGTRWNGFAFFGLKGARQQCLRGARFVVPFIPASRWRKGWSSRSTHLMHSARLPRPIS